MASFAVRRARLRATQSTAAKKRAPARIVLTLLVAALVTLVGVPASVGFPAAPGVPAALARTYYVSPQGSDSGSGKSPGRAWRTVGRVDEAHLGPGDSVLFRGGADFGDNSLMPGWGHTVAGRGSAPVVFGSYGAGRARLSQGIWFRGEAHLVFQDLAVGPSLGINATGDGITVKGCSFKNFLGQVGIPLIAYGSGWLISGNRIDRTGDSGMQLNGDHFVVTRNRVTRTSLDSSLSFGTHGIYLKASDSSVVRNTIIGFRDEGVSVRYRNSTVSGNVISGGRFGIGWHQYDTGSGTSHFTNNLIRGAAIAAIYVSPSDSGGVTNENFVITGNRIFRPQGRGARAASVWRPISLSHNIGRYVVSQNVVVSRSVRSSARHRCRRRGRSAGSRRCR